MKLAQSELLEEHLRKMRDTKDITKVSSADIATIFEVSVDAYSSAPTPPLSSPINPKKITIIINIG